MKIGRYLWFLVPLGGLVELVLHVLFSWRAPSELEWDALVPAVRALRQPGDLVVVSPAWAEPLARARFEPEWMPLADVARADARSYRRALEVSLLGGRSEELARWPISETRSHAGFELRVHENPKPFSPVTRFVDLVEQGRALVYVEDGGQAPCPWNPRAERNAGGLHGHVAFPARRFECRRNSHYFVGVTVIDDQEYKPRRCIWAHPPEKGVLVVRFSDVDVGPSLRGYAGLSYFLMRDGMGTPVKLEVSLDARSLGVHEQRDEWGFSGFEMPTHTGTRRAASLEFRISSASPKNRHFCFYAETGA